MGYINNLFIYGIKKFAKNISISGVDAVICVDLQLMQEKKKNLELS